MGACDISPDGTDRLTVLCDDIVDSYVDFADGYYDQVAVAHIAAMRPLTDKPIGRDA